MTTTIRIAERFGSDVSSRRRAKQLRNEVLPLAERGHVTLDFGGVESVSDSFSDELLGVLVEQRGALWFREHIRVVRLSDYDRECLARVLSRRASAARAVL